MNNDSGHEKIDQKIPSHMTSNEIISHIMNSKTTSVMIWDSIGETYLGYIDMDWMNSMYSPYLDAENDIKLTNQGVRMHVVGNTRKHLSPLEVNYVTICPTSEAVVSV